MYLQLPPLAGRQTLQGPGADSPPQQAQGGQTHGGRHPPHLAVAALAEGQYRQAVDEGIDHSYAIGVTGIPTFILNDQYAVVGAQPYEVFERVMAEMGVEQRAEG